MISNNQYLSSQKLNIIVSRKNLKRYITQPNQLSDQRIQIKIKESQANLFNFIKDSKL
jgi:hypothetical protein